LNREVPAQPDEVDWKIIEILAGGYQSNNTIARDLKLSEGTIRQRIKRLKELGILKVKALIDPNLLEKRQLALVMVNVAETRLLEAKAEEISHIDGVISVSIASGRYDLFVEVLVDSNHGLVRFLTEKLSAVEGITKTESFLLLKSYGKYV
jgi:Lrp/AsnC family transcriptional regulator for asnA, asnC and gidA